MLSNAYFLAKFRFDTAENEPAKNALARSERVLERTLVVLAVHHHVRDPLAGPDPAERAEPRQPGFCLVDGLWLGLPPDDLLRFSGPRS